MILKTFGEFISEVQELFPNFHQEIEEKAVNSTIKKHAGHTSVLYETSFSWFVVEYTVKKNYVLFYNGHKAEGETLALAEKQLNEAYKA